MSKRAKHEILATFLATQTTKPAIYLAGFALPDAEIGDAIYLAANGLENRGYSHSNAVTIEAITNVWIMSVHDQL